jgi:hypothetical protein
LLLIFPVTCWHGFGYFFTEGVRKGMRNGFMGTSRIYLLVVIVTLLTTAGSAFATAIDPVPDPASTVGLFSIAIVGLAVGRKFLRK